MVREENIRRKNMSEDDQAECTEAQQLFEQCLRSQDSVLRQRLIEDALFLLQPLIDGAGEWSGRATNLKETQLHKLGEPLRPISVQVFRAMERPDFDAWAEQHLTEPQLLALDALWALVRCERRTP